MKTFITNIGCFFVIIFVFVLCGIYLILMNFIAPRTVERVLLNCGKLFATMSLITGEMRNED
jgi:hypothetical protein